MRTTRGNAGTSRISVGLLRGLNRLEWKWRLGHAACRPSQQLTAPSVLVQPLHRTALALTAKSACCVLANWQRVNSFFVHRRREAIGSRGSQQRAGLRRNAGLSTQIEGASHQRLAD